MNNVLPSSVHLHEKFDLKGSTYKRQASRHERRKEKPTLKDLDFLQLHPSGLAVPAETYPALLRTIERDCRVSCVSCHMLCNCVLFTDVVLLCIFSVLSVILHCLW